MQLDQHELAAISRKLASEIQDPSWVTSLTIDISRAFGEPTIRDTQGNVQTFFGTWKLQDAVSAFLKKFPGQPANRHQRIEIALRLFDDNDNGTRMTDLLADVMHYADHYGYDFDHLVEMAAVHHRAEAKS